MPPIDYFERGRVLWFSSEDDGGPDVGISVGLGGGKALWVGEATTGRGWHIALDDGDSRTIIGLAPDDLETPLAVSFAEDIAGAIGSGLPLQSR